MKHPTKAQVQVVIDNLKKVLPKAKKEEHLDMEETSICGTVHCHAGWYVIAKFPEMNEDDKTICSYSNGTGMIANDLGMASDRLLKQWADNNPKIWGNNNGSDIFSDKRAFYHPEKRPEGAKTLKDIVEHWEEVKDRLKK